MSERKCKACGGIVEPHQMSYRSDEHCSLMWCVANLTARLAAAEAAMKAAASLPGRLWLTGQLALAEFLSGEGGENLDYTLEQYEAAKGGWDE